MNIGIIIPCYNRPEYLKRCLESVAETITDSDMDICTILHDDGSRDKEIKQIIEDYDICKLGLLKCVHPENEGVKSVLYASCETLLLLGREILVVLDSDAIVKPNWLQTLLKLKSEHPNNIVSGFNSMNTNKDGSLRNPIIEEHDNYYLKKHCNGINMCMNKHDYETHVRPALQKPGNWDFNSTNKDGFIISKPSVIQHIGLVSSMGHNDNPDVAYDF